MNVQDYRAEGFALSMNIDQAAVTRAEKDVIANYIVPIMGDNFDQECEPVRSCILALSFLLVMERKAVATRAGGKEKLTQQSTTPTRAELLAQNAATCARHIEQVRAIDGANKNAKVHDICGIYFKSNFFYTD